MSFITIKIDQMTIFYLQIVTIILCGIITYNITNIFIEVMINSIIYLFTIIKIVFCTIITIVSTLIMFQYVKDANIERKIKHYIFNDDNNEMTNFIMFYNDMVWQFCKVMSNCIDIILYNK